MVEPAARVTIKIVCGWWTGPERCDNTLGRLLQNGDGPYYIPVLLGEERMGPEVQQQRRVQQSWHGLMVDEHV